MIDLRPKALAQDLFGRCGIDKLIYRISLTAGLCTFWHCELLCLTLYLMEKTVDKLNYIFDDWHLLVASQSAYPRLSERGKVYKTQSPVDEWVVQAILRESLYR